MRFNDVAMAVGAKNAVMLCDLMIFLFMTMFAGFEFNIALKSTAFKMLKLQNLSVVCTAVSLALVYLSHIMLVLFWKKRYDYFYGQRVITMAAVILIKLVATGVVAKKTESRYVSATMFYGLSIAEAAFALLNVVVYSLWLKKSYKSDIDYYDE